MDNDCLVDFQDSHRVTYLDVASGRDSFIVCMRISDGQSARIEKPPVIFQNPNGNYPISGIFDSIDVITHCSSPKGWMTAQIFMNYFSDPRIIQRPDNSKTRNIWIDSRRIHNESPELVQALQLTCTELKIFQPNSTSTVQPLDQLVLRTFTAEWIKRWEKSEMI